MIEIFVTTSIINEFSLKTNSNLYHLSKPLLSFEILTIRELKQTASL